MAEIRKWSAGILYREQKDTPQEVFFRYPSRREAGFHLLLMTVGIVGALVWAHFALKGSGDWIGVLIAGSLAVSTGTVAFQRIWEQRIFCINRSTGEIVYLRRTPFGTRRETVPAKRLLEVRITDEGDPAPHGPERAFRLYFVMDDQTRIFLGKGLIEESLNVGGRLSRLLGIPLERPPLA